MSSNVIIMSIQRGSGRINGLPVLAELINVKAWVPVSCVCFPDPHKQNQLQESCCGWGHCGLCEAGMCS